MDFSAQKKRSDGGKWWMTFDRFPWELYLLPTIRFGWGPVVNSPHWAIYGGLYWLQWAMVVGLTKAAAAR